MPGYVQRLYPVAEGNIRISASVRRISRSDSPDTSGSFRSNLMHQMCEKYAGETFLRDWGARARVAGLVVYGLVPRTILGTPVRGYGLHKQPCSIGPVGNQSIAAHEMGHNTGLHHASWAHDEEGCACITLSSGAKVCDLDCEFDWPYPHGGIGEFGFDTLSMKAIDPGQPPDDMHEHDLMSYGSGTPKDTGRWISPRTYCRLLDHLGGGTSEYCDYHRSAEVVAESGATAVVDRLAHGLVSEEFILVRGRLSDGAASILPLYAVTVSEPPVAPEAGDVRLEVRDEDGGVLYAAPVELSWLADDGGDPNATFTEYVPLLDGASRLVVLAGDTVVAERVRTGNAPSVRLADLPGGATWESSGVYTVGWRSRDRDEDDNVVHRVEYSPDEGRTWMLIAMDEPAESIDIDSSDLPGGERALIRVTASDGFQSATDVTSSPFKVARKLPSLAIVEASDGAAFETGASGLIAIGSDHEDGSLDPRMMRWSVDGTTVAEGTDHFALGKLPAGEHSVVVTVRDSDENVTASETRMVIRPARTDGSLSPDPLTLHLEAEPRRACRPGTGGEIVARWRVVGAALPIEVRLVLVEPSGRETEVRSPADNGEYAFAIDAGADGVATVRLHVRGADGAEAATRAVLAVNPCVERPNTVYLPFEQNGAVSSNHSARLQIVIDR